MPKFSSYFNSATKHDMTNIPSNADGNTVDQIKSNTMKGLLILSQEFLDDVVHKKIRIHDTKELKDTNMVFTNIADSAQSKQKQTPQLTNNIQKNFYSREFKEPTDSKNINHGIKNKLPNLDTNQIAKLAKDQATNLNNNNVKKI